MIYFYLAWMERIPFAFANVWQSDCTDCPFDENDFIADVRPSVPVFLTVPVLVV